MTAERETGTGPWEDALAAAAMLAIDPRGLGGIRVRARAGPVRERWLKAAVAAFGDDTPVSRIAAGIADARLTGGLDIGMTLERGRPIVERGVLACADGGLVVLAMAERLSASAAGILATALEDGSVRIERDGVSARQDSRFALIALDEGIDTDEPLAPALADRLGLRIDLDPVGWREAEAPRAEPDLRAARAALPSVTMGDDIATALCAAALAAGRHSLRGSLHLMRAARCAAALRGGVWVEMQDVVVALRLVLGVRLSPPAQEDAPSEQEVDPQPPEPKDSEEGASQMSDAVTDMLVQAVKAALPRHLLDALADERVRRGARGPAGKAGATQNRGTRGRAVGVTDKPPFPGARLDVLATLRQAAPWQRVRAAEAVSAEVSRLRVRKQDFRYVRHREKTGTTAIFAVDASGSAAVERLAETKGAIELLLAECYVRRDSVALVAFRGKGAEALLEPTRSLVRAKRCLSALPGGGGTPLAGGILAALAMAEGAARRGQSVVAVFLTDGRGNVAIDGSTERRQVSDDTAAAARRFRSAGIRSMLIDTARRPQARAAELARDLGSEYLALPHGGAGAMARAVASRMEG